MTALFLVGRMLVGSYFIASGLKHFIIRAALMQSAAAKSVPWPQLAIPLTRPLVSCAGLSILLG